MESFLNTVVRELLPPSAEFHVTRKESPFGTIYLLSLPPDLTGRLIGKGGATIEAIRTLVRAASPMPGKVSVEIT